MTTAEAANRAAMNAWNKECERIFNAWASKPLKDRPPVSCPIYPNAPNIPKRKAKR